MDWQTLIPDAPSDWELLPLNGKKRPIDHNTGALLHDWTQSSGYDIDAICEMNGVVRAVGVKLGPASGGLLAVDFDGPGSTEKFQEVTGHSAADLPATIAVTSGKPHRQQRLFTVDRDWWDFLQGRRVFKQGNAIVLEFRWAGHQSAIAGDHPETNGYRWIDGASPADHEPALAPDWLLEPLVRSEQELPEVEKTADDADRAVAMLRCINPLDRTDYDGWLEVGMALHDVDPGLLSDWVEWSRQMGDHFDEMECFRKWSSFEKNPGGSRLTIRSLHHWAKQGGYKEPKRTTLTPQGFELDDEDLPLPERITRRVHELLEAHLSNSASEIDAAFAEFFRLGVGRDRAQERILMLWAERNGLNIATNTAAHQKVSGRVIGKATGGAGLQQQLPGFALHKDLHLLVSTASGGKTTALAELVTVMTARDKGFLDHEAPRTDPDDDPRTTALVIASDGEGSAFDMWDDYLTTIGAVERGAKVEIWAQDDQTGETAWNVSLHCLNRLQRRLEKGDVCIVVMDTANAIFRGAGINTGVGPIETYFRLLKQSVCRHCGLWIAHHTNRSSTPDHKGIVGHPAFQEVPSVIYLIEAKDNSDGQRVRVWHALKLRGSNYRRFGYELSEGDLKTTDGHFHQNCREQLLVLIHQQVISSGQTSAAELIKLSGRPAQTVYQGLLQLRTEKLTRPHRKRGNRLTAKGQALVDELRVNRSEEAA